MIRINLLPQAKRSAGASTGPVGNQLWAVVYLVTAGLTMIGLGVVYTIFNGRLEEQTAANNSLQAEIANLRERSKRLEEVKAQLDRSLELERVVGELLAQRTGPLRVVMELSNILSHDSGPTVRPGRLEELRQINPLAGFNESWDVRRLWVTRFDERDRTVQMKGRARTNEDVAEFLRRLGLSEMFTDVALTKTSTVVIAGLEIVEFELTCKVVY